MVELILYSVMVGIFVKGWLGKLVVFPGLIALYTTVRFYFSPKAKIILANRVIDRRGSGLGSYAALFAFKAVVCAAVAGVVGLIVIALWKEKIIRVLPGKGIAGVELGMLENQVISVLGTPNLQLNKQQIEKLGGVYRVDPGLGGR